jgi:hypothetical protein
MEDRNPYRALLISVARTGNNPEQMARGILPEGSLPLRRVLETFNNLAQLASVTGRLKNLGANWYMLVQEHWVIYAFGPRSGVSVATATAITVAARTSTTPVPWADEDAKISALGRRLPTAFKNHFH